MLCESRGFVHQPEKVFVHLLRVQIQVLLRCQWNDRVTDWFRLSLLHIIQDLI